MKFKKLIFTSLIATLIMIVVMMLHGAPLKIEKLSPKGIIDMELAGTITSASAIYNAWYPTLINRAISNTYIDFIFILSYGCFLFTACLNAAYKYADVGKKIGKWLSALMIIAALFDVFENILMLRTLTAHFSKEVIASTFFFAAVKFMLVATGIIFIIFSLVFGIGKKQGNKFQHLESITTK